MPFAAAIGVEIDAVAAEEVRGGSRGRPSGRPPAASCTAAR